MRRERNVQQIPEKKIERDKNRKTKRKSGVQKPTVKICFQSGNKNAGENRLEETFRDDVNDLRAGKHRQKNSAGNKREATTAVKKNKAPRSLLLLNRPIHTETMGDNMMTGMRPKTEGRTKWA